MTVKFIRNKVEKEEGLEGGFFQTAEWKEKSKKIIKDHAVRVLRLRRLKKCVADNDLRRPNYLTRRNRRLNQLLRRKLQLRKQGPSVVLRRRSRDPRSDKRRRRHHQLSQKTNHQKPPKTSLNLAKPLISAARISAMRRSLRKLRAERRRLLLSVVRIRRRGW